jgi:hypothetical protein
MHILCLNTGIYKIFQRDTKADIYEDNVSLSGICYQLCILILSSPKENYLSL